MSFYSPEPQRQNSTSVIGHPGARILHQFPHSEYWFLMRRKATDCFMRGHGLRVLRKHRVCSRFLWTCGCGCVFSLLLCVWSWWSGSSFTLTSKTTLGVLCWYIRGGRKGGSRIIQCSEEGKKSVHICICEHFHSNLLLLGFREDKTVYDLNLTTKHKVK